MYNLIIKVIMKCEQIFDQFSQLLRGKHIESCAVAAFCATASSRFVAVYFLFVVLLLLSFSFRLFIAVKLLSFCRLVDARLLAIRSHLFFPSLTIVALKSNVIL